MATYTWPSGGGGATLPINLTTDVTGVLPIANGGTNSSTALTNGFVMASISGAVKESSFLQHDNVNSRIGFGVTPGVQLHMSSTGVHGWDNGSGTADTLLSRDGAANTLALVNGANAQTFNIYNTSTSANANNERLEINWAVTANTCVFRTTKAGTGTARNLQFNLANGTTGALTIGTSLNPAVFVAGGTAASANTAGRFNVCNGAGNTSTSGTSMTAFLNENFNPTSTSTMLAQPLKVQATINYSNVTPGAGSYEAVRIAVTETALPTGQNYLIRASAGAAGSTDKFVVFNDGSTGINVTPTAALHTVASGAKTTSYSGNLLTNTATSGTSSVTKAGLEVQSTGTWNGTSAVNYGVYVSSVTGGTTNYDAIFNGGGNVGIGLIAPTAKLTVGSANPTNYNEAFVAARSATTTVNTIALTAFAGQMLAAPGSSTSGTYSAALFDGGTIANGQNYTAALLGLTGVTATINHRGSGTITSAATIAAATVSVTGTITTLYGVYITAHKVSGVTTAYGLYSAGANDLNYFAGKVGINQPTAGSELDVKGTIRISGASSGFVGLVGASAAGGTTYTLPSADATTAGQALTSNAAGTLAWGGMFTTSIVAVAGNVTLTDRGVHLVDTSSARTLTLPSPNSARYIVIKDATGNAATNNITIARFATEKIDTVAASYTMASGLQCIHLHSNGTDWFVC